MPIQTKKNQISWMKRLKNQLGPGFITGASDDDPSGIATYTQTGAQFGLQQTWLALFSWPLMATIQEISGRIGMVTGKGLGANISKLFSKRISFPLLSLLLLANLVNIGADLGAMAAATKLLIPANSGLLIIFFVLLCTALQIFIPYRKYSNILQILSLSLFAYFGVAALVVSDWGKVLSSLITPTIQLNSSFLLNVVAFLGTTISPYLFFWQAGQEVEEQIVAKHIPRFGVSPVINNSDTSRLKWDTIIGMGFSNLVSIFIVVSAAFTLAPNGITTITSADQAAEALRPLAGDMTFGLFTIGIIGTGLLAIPVLAGSAAYALAEMFRWKEGLYLPFQKAKSFYLTILLLVSAGALTNLLPIPPFRMLFYAAVINGLSAPILMGALMIISADKKIMKKHTNSIGTNMLGWGATLCMLVLAIFLLLSFFTSV